MTSFLNNAGALATQEGVGEEGSYIQAGQIVADVFFTIDENMESADERGTVAVCTVVKDAIPTMTPCRGDTIIIDSPSPQEGTWRVDKLVIADELDYKLNVTKTSSEVDLLEA